MEIKIIRLVPLNQIPFEFLVNIEQDKSADQWAFTDGSRTIRAKKIIGTEGKVTIEFSLEIEFSSEEEVG